MEHVLIEKPKNHTIPKKDEHARFIDFMFSSDKEIRELIMMTEVPAYLYWDKIKYKISSKKVKAEEFWFFIKQIRKIKLEDTPIVTPQGKNFSWIALDRFNGFFHNLDLHAGGTLFSYRDELGAEQKQRYISRGIIEEAIASSQLEGAHTSRRVAKQMIHEGRKPRNKSEQMILNNYRAMEALQVEYKNKDLTFELICEMHRMITMNTLDNPEDSGRLDTDEERVKVLNEKNQILHNPPSMIFVKEQLSRLISLANGELVPNHFVHPVSIAIMLHFWIAYLHPFADGNGRLARLIFYWYLLKNDYWAFAYLPISSIIKKTSGKYKWAYLYTEQDDEDLTYFIDYNIEVIEKAIQDFQSYLDKQYAKNVSITDIARTKFSLNERQVELLVHYFGDGEEEKRTQAKVYQKIHTISFPTANIDLQDLEKRGFLERRKIGRNVYYYATEKVKELFVRNK